MKNSLLVLIVLLVNMAIATAQSIIHDGLIRTYQVYVPPSNSSAVPSPLVINYHGLGSNGFEQRIYTGFDGVAADSNFIVVYPDGINQAWNSGLITQTIADDVGFTEALIDKISVDYNIDQRRVYATGMSNGGFMSYRLACELEHRIAAIASVTGTIANDILPTCQNNRPVPVMQIHGTADGVVDYNGTAGFHQGAEGSVNYWIGKNNCSSVGDTTLIADFDPADNSTAIRVYYGPCANGTEVELYKVLGGGHTWPDGTINIPINGNTNRDFNATAVVWEFFSRHSLPLGTNTEEIKEPAFQFSLSPNPFSDQLLIDIEHDGNLEVVITDLLGHTVLTKTDINQSTTLDLSDMAAGVYFVTLSDALDQLTKKVIKQ